MGGSWVRVFGLLNHEIKIDCNERSKLEKSNPGYETGPSLLCRSAHLLECTGIY